MTKEQVRNLIGVVVVSLLVVGVSLFIGTKQSPTQSTEPVAQQPVEPVQEVQTTSVPSQVSASVDVPVAFREAEVAGAKVTLSFSNAKGTVTYSGIDTSLVEQFFAHEVNEIDRLGYTMQGTDKVLVTYNGFSELDDQIVADWLLEDAMEMAK